MIFSIQIQTKRVNDSMNHQSALSDLSVSHASIIALQAEMKNDMTFRSLCKGNGLLWDFSKGYEPRWYNGPAPEHVQLLFFMAEPGAISKEEEMNLRSPIDHNPWVEEQDEVSQDNYWQKNLRVLCRSIWSDDILSEMMFKHVGGSSTFWMSLPKGKQVNPIPRQVLNYFLETYLVRFINLFPNAIKLAAGNKAKQRLKKIKVEPVVCWAFTRPGANRKKAKESWEYAGKKIKELLEQQGSSG